MYLSPRSQLDFLWSVQSAQRKGYFPVMWFQKTVHQVIDFNTDSSVCKCYWYFRIGIFKVWFVHPWWCVSCYQGVHFNHYKMCLTPIPETCQYCCHGSTPPPPSGCGREWRKCCAAPYCVQPETGRREKRLGVPLLQTSLKTHCYYSKENKRKNNIWTTDHKHKYATSHIWRG